MPLKCYTQYASKFGKLSSSHRVLFQSKMAVFISIPKKGNAKEYSNCRTIAFISHASKVMLKILQARHQQYMNLELTHVQAGFRKDTKTRDQIANVFWIIETASDSRKPYISDSLTMLRSLTMWIMTTILCRATALKIRFKCH